MTGKRPSHPTFRPSFLFALQSSHRRAPDNIKVVTRACILIMGIVLHIDAELGWCSCAARWSSWPRAANGRGDRRGLFQAGCHLAGRRVFAARCGWLYVVKWWARCSCAYTAGASLSRRRDAGRRPWTAQLPRLRNVVAGGTSQRGESACATLPAGRSLSRAPWRRPRAGFLCAPWSTPPCSS